MIEELLERKRIMMDISLFTLTVLHHSIKNITHGITLDQKLNNNHKHFSFDSI